MRWVRLPKAFLPSFCCSPFMGHPLFCSPQRGHHLKTKPLLLTEQVTKAELSKDLLDHIKFLSHDKANQMSQECKLENPGTRNGCREVIGGRRCHTKTSSKNKNPDRSFEAMFLPKNRKLPGIQLREPFQC